MFDFGFFGTSAATVPSLFPFFASFSGVSGGGVGVDEAEEAGVWVGQYSVYSVQ